MSLNYISGLCANIIVSAEAGFITEEGTAEDSHRFHRLSQKDGLTQKMCWVVDPLDGTTNFIHQYAPYAVSIALMEGKEILIGVVYEICADECFYAWKGGGAYLMHNKLHVSSQKIQDALLCLQLPYNSDAYKPTIKRLIDAFYGNVGSIRMCGSAAMALCYVAAGRLDGYAEQYIGQWDYMAGSLIVMEAGGVVTDYAGSEDFTQGNSVVATNGVIQGNLLEIINSKESGNQGNTMQSIVDNS